MKSYGQLCTVARALDVVGDRWTLLIVRELLILGSARFTDIQRGLPGIAPNLLAQRLRDLEANGVLAHEELPPPATGAAYRLTERGRALDGVVRELLKWGAGTISTASPDDLFQMHWLSMPARYLLRDNAPNAPPVVIRFGEPRDGFDVTAGGGAGLQIGACRPEAVPDVTVTGPGLVLIGLIAGRIPLAAAPALGVGLDGDAAALERVFAPEPQPQVAQVLGQWDASQP